MKLARRLLIASMLFGAFCLVAYLWRHDYYFRQSDQLYYFGLGDALRTLVAPDALRADRAGEPIGPVQPGAALRPRGPLGTGGTGSDGALRDRLRLLGLLGLLVLLLARRRRAGAVLDGARRCEGARGHHSAEQGHEGHGERDSSDA